MNNKLRILALLTLSVFLVFPVIAHADLVNVRNNPNDLRLEILSVLGQMIPLELACEADSGCEVSSAYVRSGDLMRLYRLYSLAPPSSTQSMDD